MRLNDATPVIKVDPETYRVEADGEWLTCEPAQSCPWRSATFSSELMGYGWITAGSAADQPTRRFPSGSYAHSLGLEALYALGRRRAGGAICDSCWRNGLGRVELPVVREAFSRRGSNAAGSAG